MVVDVEGGVEAADIAVVVADVAGSVDIEGEESLVLVVDEAYSDELDYTFVGLVVCM